MSKWERREIPGMCVTKEKMHYHTAVPDETAKEWYLNSSWAVSVGHCHNSKVVVSPGNPYFDWGYE